MSGNFLSLLWPIAMIAIFSCFVFFFIKLALLLIRYLNLKIEYMEAKLDQIDKNQE